MQTFHLFPGSHGLQCWPISFGQGHVSVKRAQTFFEVSVLSLWAHQMATSRSSYQRSSAAHDLRVVAALQLPGSLASRDLPRFGAD